MVSWPDLSLGEAAYSRSAKASAAPPLATSSPRSDLKDHIRQSASDDGAEWEEKRSSTRHPQRSSRRRHDEGDDEDSDASSAHSKDSRQRRVKHAKSKASRPVRARSASSTPSQSTVQSDTFLPKLGRILEGRSIHETGQGFRPATSSSLRSKGRSYSQHKHSSAVGTGRVSRSHASLHADRPLRTRSLTSPSLQSILSTLTAATSSSSGSNGSTSTVTQSSYTKSETSTYGPSAVESRPRVNDTTQHNKRRRRHRERPGSDQPDVFAYMEEDPTNPGDVACHSGSESDGARSPRAQTPAMEAHRSSADPLVSPQPIRVASWQSQDQMHSDSGISVRGSSPESKQRPSSVKNAEQRIGEQTRGKTQDATSAAQEHMEAATAWQRRWSNVSAGSVHPAVYLQQHQPHPHGTMVPYAYPPYSSQLAYVDRSASSQQQRSQSGYNLLASKLCENDSTGDRAVSPLYRRFEGLNHRILLHLQDEIAEMEEQLQGLDAGIARCKPSPTSPESRRAEARCNSDMTFQRTELLGRIYGKLRQYNEALASFNKVDTSTQPAKSSEIDCYRGMVKKTQPVAPEELRFLEHSRDLVSLNTRTTAPADSSDQAQTSAAVGRTHGSMPALILGLLAAMLVAFVLFSAAANISVRIFLFVLLSGAGVAAVHHAGYGQDIMTEQERHVCLGFYVCLLACIAATAG